MIKINKKSKNSIYCELLFNDYNTLSDKSSVVVKFIYFARLVQRLPVRLVVLASDSAPLLSYLSTSGLYI